MGALSVAQKGLAKVPRLLFRSGWARRRAVCLQKATTVPWMLVDRGGGGCSIILTVLNRDCNWGYYNPCSGLSGHGGRFQGVSIEALEAAGERFQHKT